MSATGGRYLCRSNSQGGQSGCRLSSWTSSNLLSTSKLRRHSASRFPPTLLAPADEVIRHERSKKWHQRSSCAKRITGMSVRCPIEVAMRGGRVKCYIDSKLAELRLW